MTGHQLDLASSIDAGLLTPAEHAALLFDLGSGPLDDPDRLLALIDDIYWQADFDVEPVRGNLEERDVLQLRGACKLLARHLEAAA